MRNSAYYRLRNLIFTILFVSLIFCAALFSASVIPFATADDQTSTPTAELFLPSSNLEYKNLSKPNNVYSDDSVTAIVQNDKELLIYQNGAFSEPIINFNSIKQVKKLNSTTLLFSDNVGIHSVNLSDYSIKKLVDTNGNEIGGNYFDINENYLVTAYAEGTVYARTEQGFEFIDNFSLNGDYPIALNDKGEVFFVQNDLFLYRNTVDNISNTPEFFAQIAPSKMIADQYNVYVVLNDTLEPIVKRISTNSKIEYVLEIQKDSEHYDLGNLEKPSGIAFKNGNLIISDSELNAVQEFKVEDNKLVFTGFAIASGKTAYNRVSTLATDIEKYGDSIATLDNNKLLVYSPESTDIYAAENYVAYHSSDFKGQPLPTAFALGNETALIVFNLNQTGGTLGLLDLETGFDGVTKTIFNGNIIRDVCYQSGNYYVLTYNGTQSAVYGFAENDFTFTTPLIETSNFSATQITVDVFGNIYLANDSKLYKYTFNATSGKYENTASIDQSGIKKLATDLGGKVYMLADGALSVYDGEATASVPLTPHVDGDKIKSFAMNFDKKEIYLLYENKEYICLTDKLNNYALSEAQVANDIYVTTANQADLNSLKTASVQTNANVYSVARMDTGFNYKGLADIDDEYIFICDVAFDDKLVLCALAGQKGVVLVNKTQLELSSPTQSAAPESAFVTTDVNAYYLPIITEDAEYALTDNGANVRLPKETEIIPEAKITALGKEYYFASVTVDGTVYKGYIPVSFTVEVLAQDFVWNEYVIENVSATDYYSDQSLTEKVGSLADGAKVRLVSIENGVAKIRLDGVDGTFYIKASAIKDEPNVAVRNILIILAVAASVCGTASYFILRRKD